MSDPYEEVLNRLGKDERSLEQLERECGVPAETIRDIKSGKVKFPRLNTLRALAKCFPPTEGKRAA
jgi:transcriptional regulator with XRE-family HTH domain